MSAQGEYRAFLKTYDGKDQFYVSFGWSEEEAAFHSAVQFLKEMIKDRDGGNSSVVKREEPIRNFKFETTLERQVTNDHIEEVMKVAGLSVLNYNGDATFTVVPLPDLPTNHAE